MPDPPGRCLAHHGPVRWEAITWDRLAGPGSPSDCSTSSRPTAAPGRASPSTVPRRPRPGDLAERVAETLRVLGRPSLVVGTAGFLRPASVRLQYGHQDLDAYYDGWYDTGALWREVFGPLEPGGDGRVLPDLWDPVTDRATRSPYTTLPPGGFLLLHGPLLLRHPST
ncbi:Uridine kinase OS=Streptomyces fumanus OX=67302 GN=GCM10018772_65790 PE=4 SV=1 [Streptomyces fumanus]